MSVMWVYILVLSIKYTSYEKKYGLNGKKNSKFIEKKMVRRRVKKRIWKFLEEEYDKVRNNGGEK